MTTSKQNRSSSDALDRINELPDEVIGEILKHMPIRDAVKTSLLLLKSWRYKWSSMQELVFDAESFLPGRNFQDKRKDLISYIHKFLSHHEGTVSKFEVNCLLYGCSDLDRWILVLSRRNLNHLLLKFDRSDSYELPPCLFSCQSLKILSLKKCRVNLPPVYQGLPNLTDLKLSDVNIANETFQSLLLQIPLLKSLQVIFCDSLTQFNIRAPNLQNVCIMGTYQCISFRYAPNLREICLHIRRLPGNVTSCNLDEIFGGLNELQNVDIFHPIVEILPIDTTLQKLNSTYLHLNKVKLHVNFEDLNQILAILCLCRSSPYLQTLTIVAAWDQPSWNLSDENLWEGRLHKEEDIFSQLKTVRLLKLEGLQNELGLVQFILLNAVVLETVSIKWEKDDYHDKSLFVEKMMQFKKASPEATVTFSAPTALDLQDDE